MKKTSDGRRVQRVEREVQGILSRFLLGTFKGDLPGIVTITSVQMTSDLKSARVRISVLNGTPDDQKKATKQLQARAIEMQRYLASELPLRYTPKLRFQSDESLEKVLKIDKILHELSQNQTPPNDSLNTEDEDEE